MVPCAINGCWSFSNVESATRSCATAAVADSPVVARGPAGEAGCADSLLFLFGRERLAGLGPAPALSSGRAAVIPLSPVNTDMGPMGSLKSSPLAGLTATGGRFQPPFYPPSPTLEAIWVKYEAI